MIFRIKNKPKKLLPYLFIMVVALFFLAVYTNVSNEITHEDEDWVVNPS